MRQPRLSILPAGGSVPPLASGILGHNQRRADDPVALPSDLTVAQPLSRNVAIARSASCRFKHPALDIIGLLQGSETFGEAARAFTGPPECEQKQEHGEDDGAVA